MLIVKNISEDVPSSVTGRLFQLHVQVDLLVALAVFQLQQNSLAEPCFIVPHLFISGADLKLRW